MPKKRFLIAAASIGAGHMKAAEAMREELRLLHPDADIAVVDFMAPEVSRLNGWLKKLYLRSMKIIIWLRLRIHLVLWDKVKLL